VNKDEELIDTKEEPMPKTTPTSEPITTADPSGEQGVQKSLQEDFSEEHGVQEALHRKEIRYLVPYNPQRHREWVRSGLAVTVVAMVVGCVIGMVWLIGTGLLPATVLTQTIFPAILTLAGTVLGFYFGGRDGNGSGAPPTYNQLRASDG
jgi:hypothetical protein